MKRLTYALALAALLVGAGLADAAVARYHYVPNGPNRAMTYTPSAPDSGEWWSILGSRPDANPPRPTVMMTYSHPVSGMTVAVPLALPPGTPTIYHRSNRIIYNYSGYTVQVQFLPDGSIDVIYNSGFLRGL
jgi:hypothetical protein